jgi:hypothetical protein
MKKTILVFLSIFLPILFSDTHGVAAETKRVSQAALIATTYGVAGFDRIEALRFAFIIHQGTTTLTRRWIWEPKTGLVTLSTRGADDAPFELAYNRNALDTENAALNRKADAWFVHDQYWLLCPLHLAWDADAKLSSAGIKPFPIPPGEGALLTVRYETTPGPSKMTGEAYDLYSNNDGVIVQWVVRQGGKRAKGQAFKWSAPVDLGPIKVSLDHTDPSQKLHIGFSNVAVKLEHEDRWTEANASR